MKGFLRDRELTTAFFDGSNDSNNCQMLPLIPRDVPPGTISENRNIPCYIEQIDVSIP